MIYALSVTRTAAPLVVPPGGKRVDRKSRLERRSPDVPLVVISVRRRCGPIGFFFLLMTSRSRRSVCVRGTDRAASSIRSRVFRRLLARCPLDR